ncbi:ankyrin repeat domain-containing protein [Haloplasma contractile]|uniref:Ankyrin repeat domain containing protein n=1 Tax=Haloplasma contractile SSD-17B TaxID=1033810 RepID=U2EA94_9MOLU|nr:ankyrin repeat domain-containing protein [Haloplasma contractile]ERJ12013.1 Ankyrin repeat domain containing protein [Haloplasma contractile SSD-17B]
MESQTLIHKNIANKLMSNDLKINKHELSQLLERISHTDEIIKLFTFLIDNDYLTLLDYLLTYTNIALLKRLDVFSDQIILRLKIADKTGIYEIHTEPKKRTIQSSLYTRSEQLSISRQTVINYIKSLNVELYTEFLHTFGKDYHIQLEIISQIMNDDTSLEYKNLLLNNSLINNWHINLILKNISVIPKINDTTLEYLINYIKEAHNPYPERLGVYLYDIDHLVANILGKSTRNCSLIRKLKQQVIKTKRIAIDEKIRNEQKLFYDEAKSKAFLDTVKLGSLQEIKDRISDEQVDVNIQDEEGKTVLMHAIELRDESIVMFLLDYVDVNICDYNLNTPLHILYKYKAFYKNHVFDTIIRKGASIYAFNLDYEVVAVQVAKEVYGNLELMSNEKHSNLHPVLKNHRSTGINLNNLTRCI